MADEKLPKACVILGAGESFDVANRGNHVDRQDLQPPLAYELFDTTRRSGAFNAYLEQYHGAEFLARDIAPLLQRSEVGLEEQLRHYAEHRTERIRQHYKHIPAYLRDLLWACSEQYVRMPGCYVQLVIKLLAETPHDVLFLVLNYDTLLEKALTSYEPTWQFKELSDYVDPQRTAKVIKLHGSVNWFVRLAGPEVWETYVEEEDVLRKPDPDAILVREDVSSVKQIRVDRRRLYPVLTAPLAGKAVSDMVCPDSHQAVAKEFLQDCDKFLIIGTSGQDEDLLNFLSTSVHSQVPLIHFVGVGEVAMTEHNFENAIRPFSIRHGSVPRVLYDKGFQSYASSEDLKLFAEYTR